MLLAKREELLETNSQLISSNGSLFRDCTERLKSFAKERQAYECSKCGEEYFGLSAMTVGRCLDCEIKRSEWENRKEHPDKYLKAIGVGKRYLSCSLDGFKGGHQKYIDFCRAWLSDPTISIFFTGYYGCGKTHLAVGICRELIIQERRWDIRFINAIDLLYEIRRTFNSDEDCEYVIDQYLKAEILVLDDLGAEKTTEWAIETLSLIIDRRDRELLPTIITSNLSLADITEKLSGRISSRMANGKIVKIDLPDYRKKRQL